MIIEASEANGLTIVQAKDIRKGKSAVMEAWLSINEEEVVADLTGPDPGVMYVLGIAHTIGKETVLTCSEDSRHLVDIPKTHTIEYEDRYSGRMKLLNMLSES